MQYYAMKEESIRSKARQRAGTVETGAPCAGKCIPEQAGAESLRAVCRRGDAPYSAAVHMYRQRRAKARE